VSRRPRSRRAVGLRGSGASAGAFLAAAVFALAPSGAHAAGGEYTVIQCHALNRGHQAVAGDSSSYAVHGYCDNARQSHAIQINNTQRAPADRSGRMRWAVPDQEALGIVAAELGAKLRHDAGHRARVWAADRAGREIRGIAHGRSGQTSFSRTSASFPRAASVVTRLWCDRSQGCPQSNLAKAWVRGVRLSLADYSDPTFVRLGGTLRDPGWHRGSHGLDAIALDHGAGLARITATVNGTTLAASPGSCRGRIAAGVARTFVPCGPSGELRTNPSTAEAPFRDGPNSVSVCAVDFAGNQTCDQQTVAIDNTAPQLAFANALDPDDPELIRASAWDPHSGLASGRIFLRARGEEPWEPVVTEIGAGALRARVDSAAYPPGRYELRVEASDVAGNRSETTRRANGTEMVLDFPLREAVDLNAHLRGGSRRETISYGRDSRVAGRLVDSAGHPLAGERVTVEEYFGAGALIDRRVRTVRTDRDGRWRSKLPAGPSRRVTALYEGSATHLGETRRAGRLAVRSKATFSTSRSEVPAGERVVFRGRVARLGARIPSGGKLVELQVRERAGRWNTVREAFRTGARGRYRVRYRFGDFYERDARFRFRVKVARESVWPYRAPASSRAREVIVRAR
jgi:hypothetical protein